MPEAPTRERHLAALGLSTSTSSYSGDEIKAAYREKAKKYHPDVPGTGCSQRFKAVQEAYSVLSGRQSDIRAAYGSSEATTSDPSDRTGAQWARGGTYYAKQGLNDEQEYANRSTANFYRPFGSASDPHAGFTSQEIREWQNRRFWFRFVRFMKMMCIWYCVFLATKIFLATQQRHKIGVNEADGSYSEAYHRRVREDRERGVLPERAAGQPQGAQGAIRQQQTDASTAAQRGQVPNRIVRTINAPQYHQNVAVSYKGQPFTPDGLASLQEQRRQRRGGVPSAAATITTEDDRCIEMDD